MADVFAALAARAGTTRVGQRDAQAISQEQFVARVRGWTALGRRTPGMAVALYHHDALECGAALLGAWQAGKTVWLAPDQLPATLDGLLAATGVLWGSAPGAANPGKADHCALPWAPLQPDWTALVLYTSGSSGMPKPVPKQYGQLTAELDALEAAFGAMLGEACVLGTVSHQHIYGLLFRLLWPLASGRVSDAAQIDDPQRLLRLPPEPCVLVSSPAILKRLPAQLAAHARPAQLRAVFSSGGALEPAAAQQAAALLGRAPVEVYGSTETGGIAWRSAGAPWQSLPGVTWRIGQDASLEVQSVHAGPQWQLLGDTVAPAPGGGFVLLGRSDGIVKIEEKRIALAAVEQALLGSALVAQARVLPCVCGPGQRQALAAFVVPTAAGLSLLETSGRQALNTALRAQLAPALDPLALPRRWRYLAQMPMNAQGKIPRAALLALLDGEGGTDG